MDKKDQKIQNRIVASCYYAFFINGMVALVFGAIMPMLLKEYNIGYDHAGALLSIHSFGNLIASFLAGALYIRIGGKNTLIFLVSTTLLGFVSLFLLKSPILLFIPFVLSGIGRGGISNMGNTIINDASNGDPAMLNILHTFFAIGAFTISLFASFSLRAGLEWRFIILTILILAGILMFVFTQLKMGKNTLKQKSTQPTSNENNEPFLKNIDFYLSSGILFFYVGTEYAVNGWIVTYLKDSGILSLELAQNMLSILWVIIIFGRFATTYVSKIIDKKSLLLISSTGVIVFFILFLLSSNIWMIVACVLGLGLCLSGIFPTTIANAGRVLSNSQMAMGTILAIAGVGGILMPYITGVVAKNYGIKGGMTVITVAIIFLFSFTLANKIKGKA